MMISKKVIAFSLFGDNTLYTLGAIENVRLAKEIFPDWECYFFIPNADNEIMRVPCEILESLKLLGAKLITISHKYCKKEITKGCFWRFYLLGFKDVQYCIFRDCDCRLSWLEKACVDEWINSGKDYHLMYGHKQHSIEILAGLWGAKGNMFPDIQIMINKYFKKNDKFNITPRNHKYYDQYFLKHCIWPHVRNSYIAHGNIDDLPFQKNTKISITPYPKIDKLFPDGYDIEMSYIGQKIYPKKSK